MVVATLLSIVVFGFIAHHTWKSVDNELAFQPVRQPVYVRTVERR